MFDYLCYVTLLNCLCCSDAWFWEVIRIFLAWIPIPVHNKEIATKLAEKMDRNTLLVSFSVVWKIWQDLIKKIYFIKAYSFLILECYLQFSGNFLCGVLLWWLCPAKIFLVKWFFKKKKKSFSTVIVYYK